MVRSRSAASRRARTLGFIGCDTAQPSAVVHDPTDPARTYPAQWWQGVDLSLGGTTEGGPDPIAQHATLVTIAAGQDLGGFDQCFGCKPTATPTTAPPTGAPAPSPSGTVRLAITITGHTRAHASITLTFVATPAANSAHHVLSVPKLAADTTVFTAACTSPTSAGVRVEGAASPLSLA